MFRYGDCSNCTASACFRVPSKTASPVVLTKSASSTLSFSLSLADCRERKYNPPAMSMATTARAAPMRIFGDFFCAETGAETALTEAEEAAIVVRFATATGAVCEELELADDGRVAPDIAPELGPDSAATTDP